MEIEDYRKMAEIFNDTTPIKSDMETLDTFYSRTRQHNDIISRFNVAFILGNRDIQQSEFVEIMRGYKPIISHIRK